MGKKLLIRNAKQLLTMQGDQNFDIGLKEHASILISDGVIERIGKNEDFIDLKAGADLEIIDASDKVVMPGFVDCHSHVTFGGSRVQAYAAGMDNDDPDILVKKGIPFGIYASVNMTTSISRDMLKAQTKKRLQNMFLNGTTTIEAKSGYGLSTEAELTMLRINRELDEELPLDIYSTFLGAHGWTEGMPKEKYIDLLCKEMIPMVVEEKLAISNDVWCDEGHYTAKESEIILACGLDYGLNARIHTDAYSYIGGSDLAADMKMLSADHLNFTPESVYPKLIEAGVNGVLLVGTDFAVKHPRQVNARPMLDLGMNIGLATNCCPGCWCESMLFILILACREHKFSAAEALRASTAGAARAMGLSDRGVLEEGKLADILIMDMDVHEDIIYKYGVNPIETIIKNGKVAWRK